MPKRRRRRSGRDIMKQRMGLTGIRGSKPYLPWSKTLITTTMGEGHNPGTTVGALFHLPVNNWNDPLGTLGSLVAGDGSLTSNRHPSHHAQAIVDKYRSVQVISWEAIIDCNWILAGDDNNDYMIAYTFVGAEGTGVNLAAGAAARLERLDILSHPRWTVRNLKASPLADSHFRNAIRINVPDVYAYCDTLSRGAAVTAFGNEAMSHTILDVASSSNFPNTRLFCTIAIMTEGGLAMIINSLRVTVSITQKVRIMRNQLGADDLFDATPDTHA